MKRFLTILTMALVFVPLSERPSAAQIFLAGHDLVNDGDSRRLAETPRRSALTGVATIRSVKKPPR